MREDEKGTADYDSHDEAGEQLATEDRADRDPRRQRPNHHRLGLGAHRVGHVDDGRDEEGQQDVGLELMLEAADDRRLMHDSTALADVVAELPETAILYAARDREYNNGVVLAELLGEK